MKGKIVEAAAVAATIILCASVFTAIDEIMKQPQKSTDTSSEAMVTEPTTQAMATEPMTEATTEAMTEETTEAMTEVTTEAMTEAVTEVTTEAMTEEPATEEQAEIFIYGDVDGDGMITSSDASLVAAIYTANSTGTELPSGIRNYEAADVNGDGYIDVTDVSYILKEYSDLSTLKEGDPMPEWPPRS